MRFFFRLSARQGVRPHYVPANAGEPRGAHFVGAPAAEASVEAVGKVLNAVTSQYRRC